LLASGLCILLAFLVFLLPIDSLLSYFQNSFRLVCHHYICCLAHCLFFFFWRSVHLSVTDFLLGAVRGASDFAGFVCSLIVSSPPPPTAISHVLIDLLQPLLCYLYLPLWKSLPPCTINFPRDELMIKNCKRNMFIEGRFSDTARFRSDRKESPLYILMSLFQAVLIPLP
jgi:hypothetical protein